MRLPHPVLVALLSGSFAFAGVSAQSIEFIAEQTLNLGQEIAALTAADLDGDGDADLAGTGQFGALFIFLNEDGALQWVPNDHFIGDSPIHILAANIDRDDIPDLVVTDSSINSLLVLVGQGGGQYDLPFPLRIGSSPRQAAVTDFNGDGRADLAGINTLASNVSVLVQVADVSLSFEDAVNVTVGSSPHSIIADDFDGDTFGDMVIAIGDEARVNVLDGAGDTTFGSTSIPVGEVPRWLAAEDLDQNGTLDVAVANQDSQTVSLLLGDGLGGFTAGDDVTLTNQPQWIGAADMNADDLPDLVLAVIDIIDNRADVQVLLARAEGGYEEPLLAHTRNGMPAVGIADFNGDDIRDLAIGSADSKQITVLTGRGDGTYLSATGLETATGPRNAVVGDVDGDGAADVVAATQSGSLSLFPGNGTGGFGERQSISTGGGVLRSVAIGDLDGSAPLDLVQVEFIGSTVRVLLGQQGALPQPGQSLDAGILPIQALLHRINGDENLDVAVLNSQGVRTFHGAGDGTFTAGTNVTVGAAGDAFAMGDLDGDGATDLAVSVSGAVKLFFGDGEGQFPRTHDVAVASSDAPAIDVGLLDSDSAADLVAATAEGELLIHFGTPQGLPEAPVSLEAFGVPAAVLVADFGGASELPEIVVAKERTNTVTLFESTGERSFAEGATYFAGDAIALTSGDLNGDTAPDLVSTDLSEDQVSVFFQAASGSGPVFRRGDTTGEGRLELTDAVATLNFLFLGFEAPGCRDAADTDDDGRLLVGDSIMLLNWLFQGGPEPPAPSPRSCGPDPTPDELPPCVYDC